MTVAAIQHRPIRVIPALAAVVVTGLAAAQPVSTNPGLLDTDGDGRFGDGWTVFGQAALGYTFFGDGNPGHATFYGGNIINTGGVFQADLPAVPGAEYQLTARLQWESHWEASTRMGMIFYAENGLSIVGIELVEITEDSALAGLGYFGFTVSATAPEDAAFVRPIVRFENVGSNGASRACTVDNIELTRTDGPGCNAADLADPFGVLDLGDISAFVDAFVSDEPLADLDQSGVLDLTDIALFAGAFLAGCP